MTYTIRKIEARDDPAVESVIRSCLIEFGANHEGTAWADPNLHRFSQIYNTPGNCYWVGVDENGQVVGGAGIGALEGSLCELQKMYCLPHARGTGLAHELMKTCLAYAQQYYLQCYIETFPSMIAAQKLYEKYGFRRISQRPFATGHFACDVLYLKDL